MAFITFSLLVTSCSDNESKNAALEGKWEFQKVGYLVGTSEFLENYEHTPGCDRDFQEYLSGGIYRDTYYFNMGSGCEEEIDNGTWSRSANTLTVTFGGDTYTGEILTLSETTLKIKTNVLDEDNNPAVFIAQFIRK